jgi:hypothetical protein
MSEVEGHASGLKRPEGLYMPEGYDFSNGNAMAWKSYWPHFRLRTDAVWEKSKLRDWFRSFYKIFSFNRLSNRYETVDPEESYSFMRDE